MKKRCACDKCSGKSAMTKTKKEKVEMRSWKETLARFDGWTENRWFNNYDTNGIPMEHLKRRNLNINLYLTCSSCGKEKPEYLVATFCPYCGDNKKVKHKIK